MNKTKIKYIFGCAVGLLTTAACSNSEYDYDHLFPEEYHKIVYINDEADEPFTIYDADEPHVDTITVFKAGSHPQLEGDIDFKQCTTAEMDSMSKNYTVLPANCYKVEAPFHFASDVRYAKIGISYDLEAVKSFLATYTGSQPVALALQLTSSDCTVNSEKQWYFRRISLEQPALSFVTGSDDNMVTVPFSSNEVSITTNLSIQNKWDFSVTLSADEAEQDVAAYNAAHGTDYKAMPAGSFTIANPTLQFGSGTREVSTKVNYNVDNLDIDEVYMLPVRMASCTMNGFKLSEKPLYILVDPKVTITLDMLSSPCTEPVEGSLYNLIDNNPGTFWHSVYTIRYYNDTYNHYFDVHLATPLKKQLRFGYQARNYNPVLPTEIRIYVSTDGDSWTQLVDLNKAADDLANPGESYTSPVYDLPVETNYVRFSIVRSNQGVCGQTGSGACTAVCGFDLWGK